MKLLSPSTWFKRTVRPTEMGGSSQGEMELLRTVTAWNEKSPTTPELFRSVMEFNRQVRSYSATLVDEYNSDFKGTFGSANTEIFPSLYAARSRTRTLAKDTPQGKTVVRTFQNCTVGDEPFKLEMKFGTYAADGTFNENKPVNQAVERAWKKFIKKKNFTVRKNMSFMEAFRVVEGSLIREGNELCRIHNDYPFNEFKFAVDFLEADRLQEQFQGKSGIDGRFGAGNPIRASIEYHPKYNFALAYWILTRHPGEFFTQLVAPDDIKVWREQVPASEIILFSNLRERAEQDIGMTELDAAVQPIWRNHQFKKVHVLCATASAIKAFVLEKTMPTGLDMPQEEREKFYNAMANLSNFTDGMAKSGADNPVADQQGGGTPTQYLKPGQERSLPFGTTAKVLDPKFPIEQAHEFGLDNHREVAIATGISYQHASGDFQNLGFIAGLMCQIPFQDNVRVRQKNLIDGGIDRIFEAWLKSCINTGYFDRQNVYISTDDLDGLVEAAHFKGKGFQFVNPLVQAQSLILLNEAGHLTRQQVQDQLPHGMSVEKLFLEFKNENDEMDKNDLMFGAEFATEPTINKEGGNKPGTELPDKPGTADGAPGDVPAKSKVQSPRTRFVRTGFRRFHVSDEALLKMSTNGDNH